MFHLGPTTSKTPSHGGPHWPPAGGRQRPKSNHTIVPTSRLLTSSQLTAASTAPTVEVEIDSTQPAHDGLAEVTHVSVATLEAP